MKIQNLFIHCTATPGDRKVTKADIEKWHLQGRGWSKLGYTDLIHQDGSITNLTPFDQDDDIEGFELTYGASGYNSISRHIVYAGGIEASGKPKDTRTFAQDQTLDAYVKIMIARYPDIKIAGHNQVSSKDCPSFDVPSWLRSIGVNEKNIFKS